MEMEMANTVRKLNDMIGIINQSNKINLKHLKP